MTLSRFVAIAALSLLSAACGADCGTVKRTVANGTVRDAANVSLATATADLSDNLNPTLLRLSVAVTGPAGSAGSPLRGHVTRARFFSELNELISEIPVGTSTLYVDAVVVLNLDLQSQTDYQRIRNSLLTGKSKVVLDTDLVGREHIETLLSDAHDVAGDVKHCDFTV